DGIRYFHVTGVQTCALPICNAICLTCKGSNNSSGQSSKSQALQPYRQQVQQDRISFIWIDFTVDQHFGLEGTVLVKNKCSNTRRSEERRVGKSVEPGGGSVR